MGSRMPKKRNTNVDFLRLLQRRSVDEKNGKLLQYHAQFSRNLVEKLGLDCELEGHQGCVNCLEWSPDGRRLISGSDDTNVILWDPFRHKLLQTIPTPHIGNIFSVKFLGSDSSLIATAAGDCRVIVQALDQAVQRQLPHLDCNCHVGRVKRLATAPDQPLLFWSAGEDGLVIQYDMREPHECLIKSTVFLDVSYTTELKCIAINPVQPHLLAVGANDCFIRMYDRRMIKPSLYRANHTFDPRRRTPTAPPDPSCVQYFAPNHLAKQFNRDMSYKLATTYISFDSTGNEMLVNMGGEHIYIFNILNPRSPNEFNVPERPLNGYRRSIGDCRTDCGSFVKKQCTHNQMIANNPCACDYVSRAKMLDSRKWSGDNYQAARDYLHVIQNCPDVGDAYLGLLECLIDLKWSHEAKQWFSYIEGNLLGIVCNDHLQRFKKDIRALDAVKEFAANDETEPRFDKALDKQEKLLRSQALDYDLRFVGHCNTTTDIKETNFLGESGNFICAGSDDGIIFIWDRYTTDIVTALWADTSIVNCVQPHPSSCMIASSGIDAGVKLWTPIFKDGVRVNQKVVNIMEAMEANQQRMSMDPFETMLANMGYRLTPLDSQDVPSCRTS